MFGMQILDVAIGLIFIFLLLSLVVTAANELIAAWLKRRAATMWRGVVQLLGSEASASAVYNHPLIRGITAQPIFFRSYRDKLPFKMRPSYIPSRMFVLALLDTLAPASGAQTPAQAADRLKAALDGKNDALSKQLKILLDDAEGNFDKFKQNAAKWFDDSMERVSGWYKKRTQWILMVLAVVVTLFMNADTVALTDALWHDPAVRSALVAQAQQYAQEQREQEVAQAKAAPTEPQAQDAQSKSKGAATVAADVAEPPDRLPYDPGEARFRAASEQFESSVDGLRNLSLSLGWKNQDQEGDPREPFPDPAQYADALRRHGIGWLLTALAISLGAPFWFDMLNKVISIRAAGTAPGEKAAAKSNPAA
jgi:hypothetical protein